MYRSMNIKLLTLTVSALVLSTSVNAALIDNNTFTFDTSTGLDWLDLSETAGMSYSQALSSNSGWRYATYYEVQNLFGVLFIGYYDTDTTRHQSLSTNNAYSDQAIDVNNFQSLFGIVDSITASGKTHSYTYGLYSRGEPSTLRAMGAYSNTDGLTNIQGIEFYQAYTSSFTADGHGTYLVRTSIVPIPSAVWLFGSGLICFIGLARHKRV